MLVTAEPVLFMLHCLIFRHVNGTILAEHHVFMLQGLFFAIFNSLAGLESPEQAQKHPNHKNEDNESDQAHKKSL